jgi:hypothetical protein
MTTPRLAARAERSYSDVVMAGLVPAIHAGKRN